MLKLFKRHWITTVALIVGIAVASILGLAQNNLLPVAPGSISFSPILSPTVAPSMNPSVTAIIVDDEAVKSLEWGNIIFNTPTEIQFEEPKIIELLLSPRKTVQELQAELNQQGELESAQVQISNRMEANLHGQSFGIKPLVPEVQPVSHEKTTRWKWEVTPTKYGTQSLHLALLAIINVWNQKEQFVIQTYDKKIEVKIFLTQRISKFIANNWQWLWAAILAPVVTFLWERSKSKRSQKAT